MKEFKEGEISIEDEPHSRTQSTETDGIFKEDSKVGFNDSTDAWLLMEPSYLFLWFLSKRLLVLQRRNGFFGQSVNPQTKILKFHIMLKHIQIYQSRFYIHPLTVPLDISKCNLYL